MALTRQTPTTILDLQDALVVPGRLLVFIDDSAADRLALQPPTALALYAAIVIRSDDYLAIEGEICNLLGGFPGTKEIHATKIVSGKDGWEQYTIDQRRSVLTSVSDCLVRYLRRVYLAHALADHYEAIRSNLTGPGRSRLPKAHKAGLNDLLPEALMIPLRREFPDPEIIMIQDNGDKNSDCLSPCFQDTDRVLGKAIYSAPSHDVIGLQLADVTAYSFLRATRRMVDRSPPKHFDAQITKVVTDLGGRTVPLAVS